MRPALVACALLLAGCLGGSGPGPPPPGEGPFGANDWVSPVLAVGHDHLDASLHRHTTPNFHLVGHDPLVSASYGTTVPGTLCGDIVSKDGRRLAVAQGRKDVVATVADITDPAHPQWLGEVVMRTSYVYDVAAVADGTHLALVTSSTVRQPDQSPIALPMGVPAGEGLWWRSACAPGWVRLQLPGEDLAPRPNSLLLVDIADPAQPAIADQRPLSGPGHGVSSAVVGDRVVVVASALQQVLPAPLPVSAYAQAFSFWDVQDTPSGGALVPLSTYAPPPPPGAQRLLDQSGHDDPWIAVHPGLNKPLA
ncbi:MAG TPA: hypothetical protein VGR28_04035, partial [Candidatus Thermoplasmatota archaeon]|nr:hypothetical protein [Candidatus Thermoplasmatota archaeon]